MKVALPVFLSVLGMVTAMVIVASADDDDVVEATAESTTTTVLETTTTTTTVAVTTPPSTIEAVVAEEPADDDDDVVAPELTMDVEVAQLGETFIRYRFRSSEPTAYTAVVMLDGEVVSTREGVLAAGEVKTERVEGLEPGTVYTAQATLVGPPAVQSSEVLFRTIGSEPDPIKDSETPQVEMINLRVTDLQWDHFQFDYLSNVCANGTFIVIEQESGEEVGRNNGHPNGCVGKHLGVPGWWTPDLSPSTTYVVLVTLEANGEFRGRPYGNTVTESLVVTTPPRPTPGDPGERSVDPVELAGMTQMETDASSVRVDFSTNVCSNVSFVVREVGGDEVGRHDGFPRGCSTTHSAIPGVWTDALEPDTSYLVVVTAEADGAGQGDGNVATETITVRTTPFFAAPEDPPDAVEIVGLESSIDGDTATVRFQTNICTTATVTTFEQGGALVDLAESTGDCATTHVFTGLAVAGENKSVLVATVDGEELAPGEPNRTSVTSVLG